MGEPDAFIQSLKKTDVAGVRQCDELAVLILQMVDEEALPPCPMYSPLEKQRSPVARARFDGVIEGRGQCFLPPFSVSRGVDVKLEIPTRCLMKTYDTEEAPITGQANAVCCSDCGGNERDRMLGYGILDCIIFFLMAPTIEEKEAIAEIEEKPVPRDGMMSRGIAFVINIKENYMAAKIQALAEDACIGCFGNHTKWVRNQPAPLPGDALESGKRFHGHPAQYFCQDVIRCKNYNAFEERDSEGLEKRRVPVMGE
ncbi:hypothetical protein ACLOJK_041945 [Asimina triloba]